MNEITLLLATQFQFVFSGYPATGLSRFSAGYFYIGLICTNLVVNLVLILKDNIMGTFISCKRCFWKCKKY